MSLDVYLEKPKCSTCGHVGLVYEANITHNLGPMAKEAGIYAARHHDRSTGGRGVPTGTRRPACAAGALSEV